MRCYTHRYNAVNSDKIKQQSAKLKSVCVRDFWCVSVGAIYKKKHNTFPCGELGVKNLMAKLKLHGKAHHAET
jgi:hypothetical protein